MSNKYTNLTGKRILLAEDEPVVADIISSFLTMEGATVETVNREATAIQRLNNEEMPALDGLVSDVNLSGGSGFTIARHCRQQNADFPIILISGDTYDNQDYPMREEIGTVIFMKKPFSYKDLANRLGILYATLPK